MRCAQVDYVSVTTVNDCVPLSRSVGQPTNVTAGRQVFVFDIKRMPTERPYTPYLICPAGTSCSVTFSVAHGTSSVVSRRTLLGDENLGDGVSPTSVLELLNDAEIRGEMQPRCGTSGSLITDETYSAYEYDGVVEIDSVVGDTDGSDMSETELAVGGLTSIVVHSVSMTDSEDRALLLASGLPVRPPVFGLVFERTSSGGIVGGLLLLLVSIVGGCVFCARLIAGPPKRSSDRTASGGGGGGAPATPAEVRGRV